MSGDLGGRFPRRIFLGGAAAVGLSAVARPLRAAGRVGLLQAGEGVVDITPPLGIELGGFHRAPGNERRVRSIRQPTATRALVLRSGDVRAAIVSVEAAAIGRDMAARIQRAAAERTGIPAENIRLCATHTHSMPAFCYLRQWGAIPLEYMATVEEKTVQAILLAQQDLAPTELRVGTSRAVGANHNRTTKVFKTDESFDADSTDSDRWLDTMVHVLLFQRPGQRRDLLWYHFSAHPVCHADEAAGPDWTGTVAERLQESHQLQTSFLQGHAGDVNPGDGDPWRGDIDKTTRGVYDALCRALDQARPVSGGRLQVRSGLYRVAYDLPRFQAWVAAYRDDPSKCDRGPWVDAGFAADWFQANRDRDLQDAHLPVTLAAMQVGDVGLVFHPAELYSYYGLAIRRDSPFAHTLVVGYADDIIGYLADPRAYEAGEYAAITVPKILDYPPFTPDAAAGMTAASIGLLRGLRDESE
jgi:neutral ceramidase